MSAPTMTLDQATWDVMALDFPAPMPTGKDAGMTPRVAQAAPLHAEGWQTHDHKWLGNGYVRLTLKRAKAAQALPVAQTTIPLTEADAAVIHYLEKRAAAAGDNCHQTPATGGCPGIDLRTPGHRAEDDAHAAKLQAAPDPITYRDEWFKGYPHLNKPARRALMVTIDPDGQARADIFETGTMAAADLHQLAAVTTQALACILESAAASKPERLHVHPAAPAVHDLAASAKAIWAGPAW